MSNKIIYVYYPDIRILFYTLIYFWLFLVPERWKMWKMFIIFDVNENCWRKSKGKIERQFFLYLSYLHFLPLKYSTGTFIKVVALSCCSTASLLLSFFHTLHCIANKNKPPQMPTFSLQCVFELERKRNKRQYFIFKKHIALKLKPVMLCFKK